MLRLLGAAVLLATILTRSAGIATIRAQGSGGAASAALSAALEILHGVTFDDCSANNPQRRDCVTMESTEGDASRGITVFGVSDAGQSGGFGAALGRTPDGSWAVWFTSQNPYQLLRLPGDMVICADGDGVNLRSGPSSDADLVDMLADGTRVTGEEFVLTDPVDPGNAGFGWFRVSAPETGWIYSKYLESAALDDNCALRNAQVGSS